MTNIKYKALWKLFVEKCKITCNSRIQGGKQARKSFSNSTLSNLPPPTVLPPQSHTQIILWSHCRIGFLRCDLLSVGIQIRYKYSAAVGNIYFSSTVGGKILSVDIFPDGLLSVNTLHLWSPSTRWRATSPLVQPPDRLSTQLLAAENHLYAFGSRDARWCETIISLAPLVHLLDELSTAQNNFRMFGKATWHSVI